MVSITDGAQIQELKVGPGRCSAFCGHGKRRPALMPPRDLDWQWPIFPFMPMVSEVANTEVDICAERNQLVDNFSVSGADRTQLATSQDVNTFIEQWLKIHWMTWRVHNANALVPGWRIC